jgi:hypothetical protein
MTMDRRLTRLFDRAEKLGEKSVCMPFEIFSIARGFADLPDPRNTIEQTKVSLATHHNFFVRRVFYVMLNFMGKVDLARDRMGELFASRSE